MAIELIVFDMAGTTIEDKQHVANAVQKAFSNFGYEVNIGDINAVMGYPKPVAIAHLLQHYAGAYLASELTLIDKIHDSFLKEIIKFYEQDFAIQEKDNATAIFALLRARGIKVALDTGFSRRIADTIINKLAWQQGIHFDISVTSDEVKNGRPYPDMIFKAMKDLGIADSKSVAKVGDTIADLEEGSAAGCQLVIGVTTGTYTADELAKVSHSHLIAHLEELLDIVLP